MKVKTIENLDTIKKSFKENVDQYKYRALVCSGTGCTSANCAAVKESLMKALEENNLTEQVMVTTTGCRGSCNLGPLMEVMPDEVLYTQLSPTDIPELVASHFINGKVYEEKTYFDIALQKRVSNINEIEFYKKQTRIALKNCGMMDCNSIEDYIFNDGYYALHKVLTAMSSLDVINEITESGLRGRGGGGFPTGIKWASGYKAEGKEKYIVCNGDEGDPGAFMDRSVIESVPHSAIEGMIIGGYAIGATKGYAYIRAEYELAVERFGNAVNEARQAGILGKNIFGSGFDFDIEIRIGAGAFVCGEETALINSVEGKRGEPRQKPPFPFQRGLFDKPTIINNVETFANVPKIILNGAEWFKSFGTENSKGTKVFALAGNINNTGLVEVPMGVTLGEIIFDIGGGVGKNKAYKAAQTGGPSGGCITKEYLNTPIDYESLAKLGAIVGSGGLIIMDEDTCMVDMARFFMDFVQDESCGKCVACRLGTKRMLEILENITTGNGQEGDIELLEELGNIIKDTALCGLGQTAPNPVLSTIKYFRDEYEEHIKHKYCRAGICSELFISPCENACPAGVNVPGYIALIAAGRVKDAYNLIRKDNPFPSVCGRVCTHPCESKCRRGQLDEPIAIADLKRYAADYVLKSDEPFMDLVFPNKGKSVGIIGAGPSGLTCGYYLRRLGYDVTVYEAQPVSGGILAFGIPEYRLPKEVLEKEINTIKQTGINIVTNVEVGKDILFDELKQKHDSVYIATGTQLSRKIAIEGENLEGIYHGLDFLRDVNLNKEVEVKGVVAVIGGGNTAIDAARVALRKGAAEVHLIYRRTLADMPADKREIQDAIEEGIIIHPLVAPVRFIGQDKVSQIECIRMELEGFDSSGRKKPKKIENSEFLMDVDMVIPAVSQYSDLPFVKKEEVEVTQFGTFVVDNDTLMTTMPGVFAGGDVARGSDIVITAIADGKKAAKSIDKFLGGSGELNTGEPIEIPKATDEAEVVEHERFLMKHLDADKRKNNFDEVAQGFHKLNAIAEAMRCLRCDKRG